MATAPETMAMVDSSQLIGAIFSDKKGILMRQKLDKLEIFCPALQKRNKYKVAAVPEDKGDDASDWEDKVFKKALKKQPLFTIKEESDFCCRFCLGNHREFRAKVSASKKAANTSESVEVAYFNRPFKCTLVFCCFMLNPQEISTEDKNGKDIGKTVQDYRCIPYMCGKNYWRVQDAGGDTQYVIEDNTCCNANMCAPSCCCPVRELTIYNADESEKVGHINNIFPGCNMRSFFGTADNYKMKFPESADPNMKLQLMASLVLIDFMLFEKSEDDNGIDL